MKGLFKRIKCAINYGSLDYNLNVLPYACFNAGISNHLVSYLPNHFADSIG